MANENDEVHQNNNNSNGSSGGGGSEAMATAVGEDGVAKQTLAPTTAGEDEVATCARGKLNDLVADLCLNGAVHGRASGVSVALGGFGDYTNIRATQLTSPTEYAEGNTCHKQDVLSDNQASSSTANQATIHIQPPTQNAASSFSFKHFLNSSSAMTAPSTTVTSLDPVGVCASSSATAQVAATSSSNPLQTSTGARPKVPQSASVSATSISSLTVAGGSQDSAAATRMKRSPRFSSFDSQASLAEYAGVGAEAGMEGVSSMGGSGGVGATTGFRLYPDALGGGGGGGESSDFFASCRSQNAGGSSTITTNSSDFERQFVPRSYSNYDMPPASPRHRRSGVVAGGGGGGSGKETRPTRLALNTNSSKLKLDLPIENAANAATAARSLPPNMTGDFVPGAAAAALPDFVQDHWIESWYAHEMYLNSPPNSPIGEFAEDAAEGGGGAAGGVAAVPGGSEVGAGAAATCGGPSGNGDIAGGVTNEPPSSGGGSKMLPDFLSDGPIIHSSQRLADVAAGLPSNSIGSPEDPPMSTSQLTRLRTENERLQRELNETRAALNEQTRRGNDLSRQLQERQRNDSAYNRSMSQNITLVEESLDKSKRRTAAAQSHVTKLKQQVTQLTAEVETLRRENEALREEGAVGGCSAPPSCDRPYATAAAGARGNVNVARPSRTQQLSRDLLKAASSAENNLRQLLAGVDNLRQMAADIESSELRLDCDVSPDLFSDFIDDCDDYEEYPGGPAL